MSLRPREPFISSLLDVLLTRQEVKISRFISALVLKIHYSQFDKVLMYFRSQRMTHTLVTSVIIFPWTTSATRLNVKDQAQVNVLKQSGAHGIFT